VALERQSIEKRDFPIGRRGYEPEAVDSHLAAVADEVEQLKRSSKRTETLASAASEQVRSIVEAAETSANQIHQGAESEAREIRKDANAEAQRTREEAAEQAREYVGRVSEATAVMMQRIDAMEGELTALVESLRTGSNRLNADLQLLEGNLTELNDSAGQAGLTGRPSFAPEPADEAEEIEPLPEPDVYEEQATSAAEAEDDYAEALPEEEAESDGIAALAADGGASDDTEGARLIALNMALNGTPREETDRYLAANFQLDDRDALLDEVYASVEG
jgi:cell division septum initiation protein DivIVA